MQGGRNRTYSSRRVLRVQTKNAKEDVDKKKDKNKRDRETEDRVSFCRLRLDDNESK